MVVQVIIKEGIKFLTTHGAKVVVGGGVVVVGGGAYLLRKKILKIWKGNNVAILGARNVGKTQLAEFLYHGNVPLWKKNTSKGGDKIKQTKMLILGELELKIREGVDIDGGSYDSWGKLAENADIILYLFNVYEYKTNPNKQNEIAKELGYITQEDPRNFKKKKIAIIGTHIDKYEEYLNLSLEDFEDEIHQDLFMKQVQLSLGGTENCKIILGSLQDGNSTRKLVENLLNTFS